MDISEEIRRLLPLRRWLLRSRTFWPAAAVAERLRSAWTTCTPAAWEMRHNRGLPSRSPKWTMLRGRRPSRHYLTRDRTKSMPSPLSCGDFVRKLEAWEDTDDGREWHEENGEEVASAVMSFLGVVQCKDGADYGYLKNFAGRSQTPEFPGACWRRILQHIRRLQLPDHSELAAAGEFRG